MKRLLDKIIMPANWLMHRLDPDGSRTLAYMHNALRPYYRDYPIFLEQHEPKAKAAVDARELETYLDILDTAYVITRIDNKKEEFWGDLYFKIQMLLQEMFCKRITLPSPGGAGAHLSG
jgi:hypothetical protein